MNLMKSDIVFLSFSRQYLSCLKFIISLYTSKLQSFAWLLIRKSKFDPVKLDVKKLALLR